MSHLHVSEIKRKISCLTFCVQYKGRNYQLQEYKATSYCSIPASQLHCVTVALLHSCPAEQLQCFIVALLYSCIVYYCPYTQQLCRIAFLTFVLFFTHTALYSYRTSRAIPLKWLCFFNRVIESYLLALLLPLSTHNWLTWVIEYIYVGTLYTFPWSILTTWVWC